MKPGRTLFISILALLFLGAAAFFHDPLYPVWILSGLALIPFVVVDALVLLLFTERFGVKRELSGVLTLGRKAIVRVTVSRTNTGIRRLLARSVRLFDIYPDTLECGAFPVKINRNELRANHGVSRSKNNPGVSRRKGAENRFSPGASLVYEYPVIPFDRGSWEFTRMELLLGSFLGFWQLKVVHPCASRGRTFPDFRKLASSADLAGVLESTGIKASRKRGQGLEFMSLREYRKGDSIKAIDWRATGRRRKPIVREYQEEQDQQVLLLLDSGYRLHRLEENIHRAAVPLCEPFSEKNNAAFRTQFDSALEAALLISWVALKHGDGVALGCFGAEERWLPPRKGMSALTDLIHSLYDIKSASAPSSLFSALENALSRLKRRTFIIMISNLREEDGESLSWVLKRIRQRHLLLLVSLRETEAEQIAMRKPVGKDEALETAAAFAYLSARRRLYKTWEHLGLLTLECSSHELSSALIKQYLEIKRGGLL